MKERIILGIDPGTQIMGYGLITEHNKKISVIDYNFIKFGLKDNQAIKLKKIFESVLSIIDKFNPDEIAIEAPFYGKNIQSMLKLGRAQGVAMAAGLYRDIPIFEYSPRKIKQSITGNGSASKEQVAGMIVSILKAEKIIDNFDASDALAAALCHCYQKFSGSNIKKYNGWKSFAENNKNRII